MNQGQADGFFTHGVHSAAYQLPHPRLGLPVILLVRRIIFQALKILIERGFFLVRQTEDRVTEELRKVIENDLRRQGKVPGFNRWTYETVVRQAQVENFDGSKPKKEPDLCFRLCNFEEEPRPVLSVHDALFVECKPVDAGHAAGSAYCDDGLCRFVDGDYAWAMEEGMMIGYARAGRTIAKHLVPAMQKPRRLEALKIAELPRPISSADETDGSRAEALYVSRHRREFPWPDGKGIATEIEIYHSWHKCG